MKLKLFLFLIFFCILFFSFFGDAYGQGSVEASPFRIEETVDPGERVTSFITVTNASDTPRTFYVFVKDFVPKGERGEVTLLSTGSQDGPFLSGWVDIPTEGIDFAPQEKKEIPVNFKVPERVGPGGYYGAVVFGPKPPERKDGEGSVVLFAHQVGVLALFQVRGDANKDARIREFTTDTDFYSNPFDVNFKTRVENIGNVHIKPVGTITVENMRGSQVATIPVNEGGANALPESIRRFDNKWEGDFGFGKYTATLVLSFGGLTIDSGEGVRTASAQTTFWIMPLDVVIPIGIILTIIIITGILLANWYKKKAIKDAFRQIGLAENTYTIKKANTKGKNSGETLEKKEDISINFAKPFLYFAAILIFISLLGVLIFFIFLA